MGSLVRWLSAVALSAALFALFAMLLSQSIVDAVAGMKQPSLARAASPAYGVIDPLPTGSITMFAPLKVAAPPPAVVAKPESSIIALPDPPRWRVTTAANLRSRPAKSAGLVGTLDVGTTVAVLERDGSWALVSTATGERGWVYGPFLEELPAAAPAADVALR